MGTNSYPYHNFDDDKLTEMKTCCTKVFLRSECQGNDNIATDVDALPKMLERNIGTDMLVVITRSDTQRFHT